MKTVYNQNHVNKIWTNAVIIGWHRQKPFRHKFIPCWYSWFGSRLLVQCAIVSFISGVHHHHHILTLWCMMIFHFIGVATSRKNVSSFLMSTKEPIMIIISCNGFPYAWEWLRQCVCVWTIAMRNIYCTIMPKSVLVFVILTLNEICVTDAIQMHILLLR